MLVGWPGVQPLEDWQIIAVMLLAGGIITAIVFRLAQRRAWRDRNVEQERDRNGR